MKGIQEIQEILPIKAIRVVSCGKDWVTDIDATRTIDELRGFSLDDEGVHLYCKEKDIHGEYDNIFVPYSNLHAIVFHFNESLWNVMPMVENDDPVL